MSLDDHFLWLKLLCDVCHTKLTTKPRPRDFEPELCDRCRKKFNEWCRAQEELMELAEDD